MILNRPLLPGQSASVNTLLTALVTGRVTLAELVLEDSDSHDQLLFHLTDIYEIVIL